MFTTVTELKDGTRVISTEIPDAADSPAEIAHVVYLAVRAQASYIVDRMGVELEDREQIRKVIDELTLAATNWQFQTDMAATGEALSEVEPLAIPLLSGKATA